MIIPYLVQVQDSILPETDTSKNKPITLTDGRMNTAIMISDISVKFVFLEPIYMYVCVFVWPENQNTQRRAKTPTVVGVSQQGV